MNRKYYARFAALALSAATVAGCSLLDSAFRKPAPPPPPPVVAPPVVAENLPIATHRFEIDPDHEGVIGVVQVTKASKEDTLSDLARRFNIGYEEIVRANPGVDPWLPGEGREIVLPTQYVLPNAPREGIVINVAAMRLFYYPKRKSGEKQVVYTHPIGIGKVGWATPEGTTKVIRKQKDPVWIPGPGVRAEHKENGDILPSKVLAGPDNPLGNRAMYLGWSQYLIHGTNKPYGVGLRSSHGCIRLYPEDIERMFETVNVGERVTVVNQPFVFGWHNNNLYLQALGVLEDDPRDWKKAEKKLLTKSLADRIQKELKSRNEQVNWAAISQLAHSPLGVPVVVSDGDASAERVIAAAQRVANQLPPGASWDGKSYAPVDEQTFQQMVTDSDPNAAGKAPAAAAPAVRPATPAAVVAPPKPKT